jgi:hypothetical protein
VAFSGLQLIAWKRNMSPREGAETECIGHMPNGTVVFPARIGYTPVQGAQATSRTKETLPSPDTTEMCWVEQKEGQNFAAAYPAVPSILRISTTSIVIDGTIVAVPAPEFKVSYHYAGSRLVVEIELNEL